MNAAVERSALGRRALMMLGLWLGFWLLSIGLVGLLLWIPFAQSHYRSSIEWSGFIAGCAALTLAYALRPRGWFDKPAASGPLPLRREQAPVLFSFIENIGRDLGVTAPVEIHLIAGATAFISAKRSWFGRMTSLQVGLGLPLFALLSEKELGSVIAHEFGHFVGGDLALGPWVYRTRNSIGATIHELDDSMLFLDAPFRSYGHWFLKLSSAVSRAQEYSADALAASRFGPEAAGAALEKIHRLDPLWSTYLAHDLGPAIDSGARVPIVDGFRRFCAASSRRAEVQEAIDRAANRAPAIHDSHPSLEERMAALDAKVGSHIPPLAECLHLLGGEMEAENLWYARFDETPLQPVSWDKLGTDVLKARIEKRFSGTNMAPDRLPLTELVDITQNLGSWWEKLRPDGVSFLSNEAKRRYVLQILDEWIIACLCDKGFLPQVRPGQSLVLARGGESVEPAAVLKAACDKKITREELAHMASMPAPPATNP